MTPRLWAMTVLAFICVALAIFAPLTRSQRLVFSVAVVFASVVLAYEIVATLRDNHSSQASQREEAT